MDNNEQSMSSFLRLVMMFQMAAMQQMGKLPNPLTNEIERDLQQAKASIDMLEMLEGKTKGNLSGAEKEFLDKVLFELRMDYVDETKRAAEEEKNAEKADEKEEEGKKTEGNESATDKGGTASD
jgi:hypothetical protein